MEPSHANERKCVLQKAPFHAMQMAPATWNSSLPSSLLHDPTNNHNSQNLCCGSVSSEGGARAAQQQPLMGPSNQPRPILCGGFCIHAISMQGTEQHSTAQHSIAHTSQRRVKHQWAQTPQHIVSVCGKHCSGLLYGKYNIGLYHTFDILSFSFVLFFLCGSR